MGKKNWLKKILEFGWQGIQVWSALTSLGATSVIAAIVRHMTSWSWQDQTLLFGGIFITILGVLAAIILGRGLKVSHTKITHQGTDKQNNLDWLKSVLSSNQANIYKAVDGHIVRWNFSGLNIIEDPYFEIHFRLFNTSIFSLDFLGVEGVVVVGEIKCRTIPTANSPQRAIEQGQEFRVTVTQAVLPEMAKKILGAGNNKEKLNFDFSQLRLNIQTATKGYEGLKPYVKFESTCTPDIAAWLGLQASQKIGYWS